ncbi:hypothetical protein PInf_018537 [Phytophthora infestans]|nr:hypothetical protein PInf_018537 [Phytophthora infestans]
MASHGVRNRHDITTSSFVGFLGSGTQELQSAYCNQQLAASRLFERLLHPNDSQLESIRKMDGIFGMEALQSLVASTPAEQLERVNAFDAYEQGLIAHVRENLQAPAAETNPPHAKPIRLSAEPYEGEEGENLNVWVREPDLAKDAALISTEQLRVVFVLSNLSGRTKGWVYMREAISPG